MGRTATSKLERANYLDKEATSLLKRDPEASRMLKDMAHSERRKAIRQMKRRPRKRTTKLLGR
jgi:hypothetical protein